MEQLSLLEISKLGLDLELKFRECSRGLNSNEI
jgi:hypothetical protein